MDSEEIRRLLDVIARATSPQDRKAALGAFSQEEGPQVAEVFSGVHDDGPERRRAAAEVLGHILDDELSNLPHEAEPADNGVDIANGRSAVPAPAPDAPEAPARVAGLADTGDDLNGLLDAIVGATEPDDEATALGAISEQEAGQLCDLLTSNETPHRRKAAAAKALGHMRLSGSVAAINTAATDSGNEPIVRKACVEALAHFGGSQAVEGLVEVIAHDDDGDVRSAAMRSLASRPDAIGDLTPALTSLTDGTARERLIDVLVKWGNTGDHAETIQEVLLDRAASAHVRSAAATALRRLRKDAAIRPLLQIADDNDSTLRVRVVEELEKATLSVSDETRRSMISPLMELLVTDKQPAVRRGAADALSRIDDGDRKVQALFAQAKKHGLYRGQLDGDQAVKALDAPNYGDDETQLVDYLIREGQTDNGAIRSAMADVLIANADGNPLAVGDAIDSLERDPKVESAKLQSLRIEVGGATALDPLLRAAQQDLETHFRKPIEELNARTRDTWAETVRTAQRGFSYRTTMSWTVFVVGMLLLILSVVLFLFGDKDGAELWGPGLSFAGGMASILLTVYTGPLKDIRQSVTDLAAANAAYIGYVHAILQISHTFSRRYLDKDAAKNLSFTEMGKSTRLIQDVMHTTVDALRDIRHAPSGSAGQGTRHDREEKSS